VQLVKSGAKTDFQDKHGDTILHWAAAMESLSLVKFCIEDLNTKTDIPNAVFSYFI